MSGNAIGKAQDIDESFSRENAKLSNAEIDRYSRQMLLSNFGIEGQLLLKKSSVLIVGAGGLGCPSSLYLAASGVGHIGIVDYDEVEVNNLHRQILHTTVGVGVRKVDSAATFIKNLNPHIKVTSYPILLNNTNSFDIMSNYDVIIDATDNVPTRYLLNDTCVRLSKPLVSGSALQMEGQLTIYNYKNGPCYRCIFPIPPPSETVTNCGDGGVLGMIPGVIGLLQALETVKIILNQDTIQGYLLLFNGCDTTFKKIKLRPRNPACEICGQSSNRLSKPLNQFDYEEFCGSKSCDKSPNLKLLPEGKRITATKYNSIKDEPHVLVDVRYEQEFGICKLENSLNIPITKINSKECIEKIEEEIAKKKDENVSIYVMCRRGNDSQKAVIELEKKFPNRGIKDIIGGLHAWAKEVDNSFPIY